MARRVVVIGAGFGGLAAALRLRAAGHDVTVCEAQTCAGGKAGRVLIDGVACDTGPSVVTMPEVFVRLFAESNLRLADHVTLVRTDPSFDYRWPDGARLLVFHEQCDTLASVREAFGAEAAAEFERFLAYSKRIWEAAAPAFIFGQAPSLARLAKLPMATLAGVRHIDALRSMQRAIESMVREPHLRDVLLRYATYNGSDPRVAPATLNCIAHVELGLGGWGVRGGISALVDGLVGAATRAGVDFRWGAKVDSIEVLDGRAVAVRLAGERLACDAVVSNADVAHLARTLLAGTDRSVRETLEPSMSGWTMIVRSSRAHLATDAAHIVLFPRDYSSEFADLFDRNRPPADPTVYACRQRVAHQVGTWEDGEPLFVMANAPAEPPEGQSDPALFATLEATMRKKLVLSGLIDEFDRVAWRRSPTDLAHAYPGTRGAIYGAASNDRFAAFKRAANRLARPRGVYIASGSAHPGGGVPLCAQSGWLAAEAAIEDLREKR